MKSLIKIFILINLFLLTGCSFTSNSYSKIEKVKFKEWYERDDYENFVDIKLVDDKGNIYVLPIHKKYLDVLNSKNNYTVTYRNFKKPFRPDKEIVHVGIYEFSNP